MKGYGTVYTPVVVNAATVGGTGTIQVIGNDQRWDVDEIDIVIGVLTNGYVRIGYGPLANAPMIQEWDGVNAGESIRMKNLGVDNTTQGAVNIYYAADAVTLRGQIGAHMVKQTTKKWIQTATNIAPNAAFTARQGAKAINFTPTAGIPTIFYMGGTDGSNAKNDVWKSTDGINFTQIAVTPFSARWGFGLVQANGLMYVIGGFSSADDSAVLNDVWSSADGITWTQCQANAPWAARGALCAAVMNGLIYVYGGATAAEAAALNDVWSSPDGITWTEIIASASWGGRWGAASLVWNNRIWLLGGKNTVATVTDIVWFSPDGKQWLESAAPLPFPVRSFFAAHVQNQNRNVYIFGGINDTVDLADVWKSPDGGFWYEENSAADFGIRSNFASCLFGGSMYLIGGTNGTVQNDVWRSNVELM